MSAITTHILDTSSGRPAAGVAVTLEIFEKSKWTELAKGTTNDQGRIGDLLKSNDSVKAGTYRLVFDIDSYFKTACFYPQVTVEFKIHNPKEHFHIPLLMSPYGYSTYRGS